MLVIRLFPVASLLAAIASSALGYGSEFLRVFPGGRHAAMAGTGAAAGGEAEAAFYNPAGLAFLRSAEALAEYSRPSQYGPPLWATVASVPVKPGLSLGAFASGSEEYPDGMGVVDVVLREYEAGLAIGGSMRGWLAGGLNLKYVGSWRHSYMSHRESTWVSTSYALAADAGILARFQTGFGRLGLGLAVRNVGTKMGFAEQPLYATSLPSLTIAGAEWSVSAKDLGQTGFLTFLPEWLFPQDWVLENMGWTLAYDLRDVHGEDYSMPDDYSLQSLGFELRPIPFLAARIGRVYTNRVYGWPEPGFTWGLGLNLRYLRIDLCDDHQLGMLGYYSSASQFRVSASLNISEPLVRPGGLFGSKD